MLQISRNFLSMPIDHIYFDEQKSQGRYVAKISRYTHRLKPSRQLQRIKTVHINLQQDEDSLFYQVPDLTKDVLFDTNTDYFKISTISNPTKEQLMQFQKYYNEYAKVNNLERLNRSKMSYLSLIRDKGGLFITKISNEFDETLSYRVYILDEKFVLLQYAVTAGLPHLNDIVYKANLLLCWENIKMFRKLGYKVYDFGGDNGELRCSKYFGGEMVTVYSGYIANTKIFKSIATFNRWMEKRFVTREY